MKIAIVHNRPVVQGNESALCSADVLDQVEAIQESLEALGHESVSFPLTLAEAPRLPEALRAARVGCAFNLCESLDEDPRLQGHVACLLDLAGIAYTGSDMLALALTTDKYLAKKAMLAAGIPTPRFALYGGQEIPSGLSFPLILKPRYEDGSVGIEQDSVVTSPGGLEAALARLYAQHGEIVIEEYVEGRELNVSLLGYPSPEVLPVAEISFEDSSSGPWRIVGYRAKWVAESREYSHTLRFFPTDPAALAGRDVAAKCFRLFGCRDYARVDLRLAADGAPYVLEVNANPCISPDAGFAAALAQAGISYREFVARLLGFALQRAGR